MNTIITIPQISIVDIKETEIIHVYKEVFEKDSKLLNFFGNPTIDDYLDKENTIYKILLKDKVIGYIATGEDTTNSKNICIWSFYIYPSYRKKGFGSLALNMMIDFLKRKYDYVFGFCHSSNPALFYYIKRFRFLKKDCYHIDYIKRDLSNVNEFNKNGNDLEVIFSCKYR